VAGYVRELYCVEGFSRGPSPPLVGTARVTDIPDRTRRQGKAGHQKAARVLADRFALGGRPRNGVTVLRPLSKTTAEEEASGAARDTRN